MIHETEIKEWGSDVPIRVEKTYVCDRCNRTIDSHEYIDATVYGAIFHYGCWEDMNGHVVAKVLNLDDIDVRNKAGDRVHGRAWGYPTCP